MGVTIRTSEIYVNDPPELLLEKVRVDTQEVEFGLFNFFSTAGHDFRKKWIGQISRENNRFKLFRVKGFSNTSDISVLGEYIVRLNKPMVRIRYKVHFTAFLGLLGVLIFIYALWFLLKEKGVWESQLLLILMLTAVGIIYAASTVRDLNRTEEDIRKTLSKRFRNPEEVEKLIRKR